MKPREILRFVDVVPGTAEGSSARLPITLELAAGSRAWILADDDTTWSYGDLAEGLTVPARGRVEFMGEDWGAMGAARQEELRARIGRVFEGEGWISNLHVYANVALSQLHHTRRSVEEILQEAKRLAGKVGLEEFPDVPPDRIPFGAMKRVEWIRAFMGDPRLVILEKPEQGVTPAWLEGLRSLVDDAAQKGAAILGVVKGRAIWDNPSWAGRRLRCRPGSGEFEEVHP